ncbi:hypothetical protein ACIRPK_09390 [Kitasatospora sp. NPDC101801]|uniref:hypothetical protein n=1 Tax=Kitasatospora sp. NPDC101801 TaxID=3364103 RepID=UPI0038263F7E
MPTCRSIEHSTPRRPTPDDLTPVTRNRLWSVRSVVYDTAVMPTVNRPRLPDAIRAQPLVRREGRWGVHRPHHRHEPGSGAALEARRPTTAQLAEVGLVSRHLAGR